LVFILNESQKEYIEYLQRTDRTVKKGLKYLNQQAMYRNVGIFYGMKENDFEMLDKMFTEEENNNGDSSSIN